MSVLLALHLVTSSHFLVLRCCLKSQQTAISFVMEPCHWGEPERALHSHVLKMSVFATLQGCLLLAPLGTGGSYCVLEGRAMT